MIRRSSHSVWGNLDFLAVTGSGSWSRWGSRGVVRSSGLSGATATTEASSARKTIRTSSNSNSSDSITSSGIRLIRANQVRGRNLPLFSGSQKMVVPASHVPEELINQVQVIYSSLCYFANYLPILFILECSARKIKIGDSERTAAHSS